MKKAIKNKKDKVASSSSASSSSESMKMKRKKRPGRKSEEEYVEVKREEKVDEKILVAVEEKESGGRNEGNREMNDNNSGSENIKEVERAEAEEEEAERDRKKAVVVGGVVFDGRYRKKERCLVVSSRGVTARYRHLLEDLRKLMPHHKKDYKLDPTKSGGASECLTEICEVMSCNSYLYMECRKRMDAYLWVGLAPHGPSARFYVWNVHTMDELRLTGNCMKGSRPVLSFDHSFDSFPHLKLLKTLFTHIFGTPRGHPKSKPFVDRVMGFYYADRKIWVRNYQIVEDQASLALQGEASSPIQEPRSTSLVEIGPRFVLNPMKIFSGSMRGQVLFQNTAFVSPNQIRAQEKLYQGKGYEARKEWERKRKERADHLVVVHDPLDSVFR